MQVWSGCLVLTVIALTTVGCADEQPSGAVDGAVATQTVTETVTPSVDAASQQAQELARQACQSFTDAYAVGPSSLYFPRAETLSAQAAERDVKWAMLAADMVSAANRDSVAMSYAAGRRAQKQMEKAVADACTDLGVNMVYHNGDPIGQ
jgi:hypothetical protein